MVKIGKALYKEKEDNEILFNEIMQESIIKNESEKEVADINVEIIKDAKNSLESQRELRSKGART